MTQDEKIREALKGLQQNGGSATILAQVKSVDEATATITVDIGNGVTLEDVRLRSVVDDQEGGDQGFYIVPAVDSQVLILRLGKADDFLAVGFSKYDKIVARGTEVSLVIENDKITFNDAALSSYMTDINKLVQQINKLETQVNNLKTVFTNWVPVPQDGGYSLKMAAATWAGSQMTQTTKDDIKDETILN
jgi:hypothetical protein